MPNGETAQSAVFEFPSHDKRVSRPANPSSPRRECGLGQKRQTMSIGQR